MENIEKDNEPKVGHITKFFNSIKEKLSTSPKLNQDEQLCLDISFRLITNPQSVLTWAPISHKRLLKDVEGEMFIVLHSQTINLMHPSYNYNVYIEDPVLWDKLITTFDEVLENERKEFETQEKEKIEFSLRKIYDSLT